MRTLIYVILLYFLTYRTFEASAQIEKGDIQIGISGLPIVDIFNIYPENKIRGLGLSGQIGFFPHKNMYVGINPYFVNVKNRYPDSGSMTEETIKIYGINTTLSYYVSVTSKFYLYAGLSFGIGAADHVRVNDLIIYLYPDGSTYPTFTVAPGIGLHYFITKNMTLNFNLPLVYTKYISYTEGENFSTIAPTIGVGFFF